MNEGQREKAKRNIIISIGSQFITLLCGLLIPGLMIRAFGSEAYGATTSIAQFLAYITLLEGGIGGVARAALYKPLAENDTEKISAVVSEIKQFFRVVGYIFAGYVLILAVTFKYIAGLESMEWLATAMLVIVISISTFAQYFIGISNSVLLQAAQMSYITQGVSIGGTIANAVVVIVLVYLKADLLTVKLASSIVFVLRPVVLAWYVKKQFKLRNMPRTQETLLKQKWSGLAQHIAFFLHSNTDVAVLTIFSDMKSVAVYSVYNMIIANMQSLISAFTAGMEALFGDMLAKKEMVSLHKTMSCYETIMSIVSVTLLSSTAVLIIPFVKLYTAGVTDADYYAPVFAVLMILSTALYCMRMPYHAVVTAAGHFKQTQLAAYGESAINVIVSIMLVGKYGLVGIATGTVAATAFRFLYYVFYLSKNIMNRNIALFIKRLLTNACLYSTAILFGYGVTNFVRFENYFVWLICGVVVCILSGVITIAGNLLFYRNEMLDVRKLFLRK